MNEIKKSEILTESGTNELEIIEFHLLKSCLTVGIKCVITVLMSPK